jgi:hypothetical protein
MEWTEDLVQKFTSLLVVRGQVKVLPKEGGASGFSPLENGLY